MNGQDINLKSKLSNEGSSHLDAKLKTQLSLQKDDFDEIKTIVKNQIEEATKNINQSINQSFTENLEKITEKSVEKTTQRVLNHIAKHVVGYIGIFFASIVGFFMYFLGVNDDRMRLQNEIHVLKGIVHKYEDSEKNKKTPKDAEIIVNKIDEAFNKNGVYLVDKAINLANGTLKNNIRYIFIYILIYTIVIWFLSGLFFKFFKDQCRKSHLDLQPTKQK